MTNTNKHSLIAYYEMTSENCSIVTVELDKNKIELYCSAKLSSSWHHEIRKLIRKTRTLYIKYINTSKKNYISNIISLYQCVSDHNFEKF